MTTKTNRLYLEQMFFVFVTQSATSQDFKNYYNLIKTNSFNNVLKKIKVFFRNNYNKGYKNYVYSILTKEHTDIIEYFDYLYPPHLLPKELLNYIDEKLLSIPENLQVDTNTFKFLNEEFRTILIMKNNVYMYQV